jgi:hypothetical protein
MAFMPVLVRLSKFISLNLWSNGRRSSCLRLIIVFRFANNMCCDNTSRAEDVWRVHA